MSGYIRGERYLIRSLRPEKHGQEYSEAIYIGDTEPTGGCFRLVTNLFGRFGPASSYSDEDSVNALAVGLDVTGYPFWTYTYNPIEVRPLHAAPLASPPAPHAAPCHCQNLLAGHDSWCSYHKPEENRGVGLWGIKRQDSKTRAETNAEHMNMTDKHGPKVGALMQAFGGKP